jgi:tetraacyldisaccharide 4'-kinase
MREPGFWQRPASWQARLLAPVATIYGAIAARRMQQPGARAAVPVICIGNYHTGGAGKTPTVLALAARLRDMGERPVVVSRGYGGRLSGPLAVVPAQHRAADVGDEPLMMAQELDVVVAHDRAAGAARAIAAGASVVLLDDGFQNPALRKDASLIVIDGRRGLGNGAVFPAGPLRAPLPPQLARTDALLVIGAGEGASAVAAAVTAAGKPVWRGSFVPDPSSLWGLRGRRCLAFAGIGDPARFFATLRDAGIEVAREAVFADHHPYTRADLAPLLAAAKAEGLGLVTTAKDMVRITGEASLADVAAQVTPFRVELRIDGDVEGDVEGWLAAALRRGRGFS